MGFGRTVRQGSLPVFSVETEADAEELIALTCSLSLAGEYYSPELARLQTLENLAAFSDRLARGWDRIAKSRTKSEETGDG